MEKRKNPEKDLRKQSSLFFQIGLLAALMLAVCAFEYRTASAIEPVDLPTYNVVEQPLIPITAHTPPPKPPKPKVINPIAAKIVTEPLPKEIIIIPERVPDFIPELIPDPIPEEKAREYHDYVEQMPSPVGGYTAFYKFISEHLKYPSRAKRLGLDGKVFVQFIVDEKGRITNVKTIRGAGAGLDEEAVRVLSLSPDWNPGRQGGRKVRVRMVIPINFRLAD